jgi:hypothetical protein
MQITKEDLLKALIERRPHNTGFSRQDIAYVSILKGQEGKHFWSFLGQEGEGACVLKNID